MKVYLVYRENNKKLLGIGLSLKDGMMICENDFKNSSYYKKSILNSDKEYYMSKLEQINIKKSNDYESYGDIIIYIQTTENEKIETYRIESHGVNNYFNNINENSIEVAVSTDVETDVENEKLPIPKTNPKDIRRTTIRVDGPLIDKFNRIWKINFPEHKQHSLLNLALQMFIDKYK